MSKKKGLETVFLKKISFKNKYFCIETGPISSLNPPDHFTRGWSSHLKNDLAYSRAKVDEYVLFRNIDSVDDLADQFERSFTVDLKIQIMKMIP